MEVSKAAEDILNNPRFEGAIDTIKGVTQWTDVGFATVITFVAFMIICVAMLKNVLAGAYCAYPKFWDHVNEAHKNKQGKGLIQQTVSMFQGGLQGVTGGAGGGQSIGDIIYGIIPDVKHMTDFEEGEFSAKHYFMKAIPQMLVCVALGAFIYNGTYRDVAALWVNTGTTLINRTLLEFDPIAMFDNFTGTAGRPVFGSDNAVDQFTQNQNVIATNLYTQIIGTYKDIKSAEQKRLLADACDTEARRLLTAMSSNPKSAPWVGTVMTGAGETQEMPYKLRHQSTWSSKDMTADCDARVGQVGENPPKYQFAFCTSLEQMMISSISSETHETNGYIVHVLQFTEGTKDPNAGSASNLVWELNNSASTLSSVPISGTHAVVFGLDNSSNSKDRILYTQDGKDSGMVLKVVKGSGGGASTDKADIQISGTITEGHYSLSQPIAVTYTTTKGVTEKHTISTVHITSGGSGKVMSPDENMDGWFFTPTNPPSQSYADAYTKKPASTTPEGG